MKVFNDDNAPLRDDLTRAIHVWIDAGDDWHIALINGMHEKQYVTFHGNTAQNRRMAAAAAAAYADDVGAQYILANGLSITEWINKALACNEVMF